MRESARALDGDLPLFNVRTLDRLRADSLAPQRFQIWLLGSFAAMALLLAALGIYGVLAYSVSRRTHEIGLRLAMGAEARDVLRMVMGEALRLTPLGVGIGLAAAFALMRLMQGLLFGVSPNDLPTFIAIALLLIGVAMAACWVPARRAARVDPMIALREQ